MYTTKEGTLMTSMQQAAWNLPWMDDSVQRFPPCEWRHRNWRVGLSLNK